MSYLRRIRRYIIPLIAIVIACLGCAFSIYLNEQLERFPQAIGKTEAVDAGVKETRILLRHQYDSLNASRISPPAGDTASPEVIRMAVLTLRQNMKALQQFDPDRNRARQANDEVEQYLTQVQVVFDQVQSGTVGAAALDDLTIRSETVRRSMRSLSETYGAESVNAADMNNFALALTVTVLVVSVWFLSRHLAFSQSASEAHEYNATHDPLTSLPNRVVLNDYLTRHTAEAMTILFIDMDGFKLVNDTQGHDVGDALLTQIARILRANVPPHDLLVRFGGDEFVAVLSGSTAETAIAALAETIISAFHHPLLVGSSLLRVSASVGVAYTADVAGNAMEALRAADMAMYEAKQKGKGRWSLYSPETQIPTVDHLKLGQELHGAIEGGEMRLAFQPIWDVHANRLVGFEALVRWQHPSRGELLPGDFLSIAQSEGLLVSLDRWVLREACRQRMEWKRQFPELPVYVSVNLSPVDFLQEDFVEYVVQTAAGLSPSDIHFELLEHDRFTDAFGACHALTEHGFRLALDDFGAGYFGVSSLVQLPVRVVKLHSSLMQEAVDCPRYAAIVRGITDVVLGFGMTLTAEGIETEQQLEMVKSIGIQNAQGFFLGKPLSPDACAALLQEACENA